MACVYPITGVAVMALALMCFVNGDGSIKLRFDRYTNPGGLGDNGHCCDGKYGVCQRNGCDHVFIICLNSEAHENEINPDECKYGIQQSSEIKNQNDIEFGLVFGGVDNPMSFDMVGQLPESFQLMVDVWDEDDLFSDDRVEFLRSDVVISANSKTQSEVVLEGRTKLEATVWIECAPNYYGRLCEIFCLDPGPNDNYVCDPYTGETICNPGWTGFKCVDQVTTLKPTTTTTTTTATPKHVTTTTGPTTTIASTTPKGQCPDGEYYTGWGCRVKTVGQSQFCPLYTPYPPFFGAHCDHSGNYWYIRVGGRRPDSGDAWCLSVDSRPVEFGGVPCQYAWTEEDCEVLFENAGCVRRWG